MNRWCVTVQRIVAVRWCHSSIVNCSFMLCCGEAVERIACVRGNNALPVQLVVSHVLSILVVTLC